MSKQMSIKKSLFTMENFLPFYKWISSFVIIFNCVSKIMFTMMSPVLPMNQWMAEQPIHKVPAWLFLISRQFKSLEAGPEMQVLAIVTLPISRCLSCCPKEEPPIFEVNDWCHRTGAAWQRNVLVELVQFSSFNVSRVLCEIPNEGGKKRKDRKKELDSVYWRSWDIGKWQILKRYRE